MLTVAPNAVQNGDAPINVGFAFSRDSGCWNNSSGYTGLFYGRVAGILLQVQVGADKIHVPGTVDLGLFAGQGEAYIWKAGDTAQTYQALEGTAQIGTGGRAGSLSVKMADANNPQGAIVETITGTWSC